MNANLEHNNWQQKLSRWLSGDANRREEAHLDKMAREDPFLADALEGYRSAPEGHHTRKVTQLKAKLRQQNEQKKGVAWMKIAAIGAFLVIALFGLREYNQSVATKNTVAQKETNTPPSISATHPENLPTTEKRMDAEPQDELVIVEKEAKAIKNNLQKNSTEKRKQPPTPSAAKPKPQSSDFAFEPIADVTTIEREDAVEEFETFDRNIAKDAKIESQAKEKMEDFADSAPVATEKTSPPSPLDAEEFDKAYAPVILSNDMADFADADNTILDEGSTYIGRVVKGKVLSEGGEPLIGANVIITGTPAGTITDIAGDFTLSVPPDNTSIDIHYIGYEDVRVDLENQNDIRINMESAQDLSEIVVTGKNFSAKKSRSKRMETEANFAEENIQNAAPKIGFERFDKYIKKNIQLQNGDSERSDFEAVIVQFKVKKNGTLSNFKIIQSVNPECDAEAIRLLQEGPKWNTGIDTVTSYSIDCK